MSYNQTGAGGAVQNANLVLAGPVGGGPGDPTYRTLTAADLPSLDAITPPAASVNFNGQQAVSFRIENRTSDPAGPAVGQIWLRTDL